jgi:predicted secreted protein
MATQATQAYLTTLSWNGTEIAELTSISGPASKTKPIDCTNFESGGIQEYISGLLDSGLVSVEGNFTDETGQAGLMTDFSARTARTLLITTFSAHTFTATAICTEFAPDFKLTEQVKFKATFQVSGVLTFA